MKKLSRPSFHPFWGMGLARWLWLVLGSCMAWTAAAQANPNLYVCPGPLFTNDLAPAQAKVLGCELAARGRLSQAQNLLLQDMPASETERSSAPAETASGPASTPPVPPASVRPFGPSSVAPLSAFGAPPEPMAATAPRGTTLSTARRPTEPVADASRQRQRDSHARDIVLAELARTQARIQTFSEQPPSGPDADSALQRLKRDEDALRRELARRPG